jgi:hypothetical protein
VRDTDAVASDEPLVAVEDVARAILILRGQRVILGRSSGTTDRFPDHFVFRLTRSEVEALNRSQSMTGSQRHRNPRFPPFALTEHSAIQAANVLNSPRPVTIGCARRARLRSAAGDPRLAQRPRAQARRARCSPLT